MGCWAMVELAHLKKDKNPFKSWNKYDILNLLSFVVFID